MSNYTTTASVALTRLKVIVTLIAIALSHPSFARTWGSPVNLNVFPFASSLSVKLDDAGRAVGVSSQGGGSLLVTHTQNSSGEWSMLPGLLSSPVSLPTDSSYDLKMSATGLASLLLQGSSQLRDKLPGKPWQAPIIINYASNAKYAVNSKGDAVMAWAARNSNSLSIFNNTLVYMRRPAGGLWSKPQTVTFKQDIDLDKVAIGENGDALLIWRNFYGYRCGAYSRCYGGSSDVNASRQNNGQTTWQHSMNLLRFPHGDWALTMNGGASYKPLPLMDGLGHAVLLYQLPGFKKTFVRIQTSAGQPWSLPSTIMTNSNPNPSYYNQLYTAHTDKAGNLTLVFALYGNHQTPPYSFPDIVTVRGHIPTNTWHRPQTIVTNPVGFNVGFAANGAAIVTWYKAPINGVSKIMTIMRANSISQWQASSVAATINNPLFNFTNGALGDVAINSNGKAIVTYSYPGDPSYYTYKSFAVTYQ